MVDMLSQKMKTKTVDVGKLYGLCTLPSWNHIVVLSQPNCSRSLKINGLEDLSNL